MNQLARIDRWTGQGAYIQAYHAVLTGLEASPGEHGLLQASRRLSAALRSRCMDLGSAKATEMSLELAELGALLALVTRLNGEGVYR